MSILEQNDFFERFNDQGLTFQAWMDTIEKAKNKKMINNHFTQSSFLIKNYQNKLNNLRYQIYILAIVADWCGDCHREIPVLVHIADLSPYIKLKFLIKEKNLDLMKTTNGGEKIPFVLFYGEDGHQIAAWVERSTMAYEKMAELYERIGYDDYEKISIERRELFSDNVEQYYRSSANEIVDIIERVNLIQGTSRRINLNR